MKARGFTLIELVFAMLIVGLISSLTLPRLSNIMRINLRTGATEVAGYLRNAYERSVLRHERIRVRMNLGSGAIWAETYESPGTVPLIDDKTKLDDVMEQFEKRDEELKKSPTERLEAQEARYKKIEAGSLKRVQLPQGIKFQGIYRFGDRRRIEEGSATVDFFPSGFAQEVIVYVTNDQNEVYSVILPPLSGRSRVERGEVRPEDA